MSNVNNQKLSVRIVKADYYLAKPVSELNDPCYSGFRSLPIYHVPVIRIFGPTSEGLKACVHIHGVFPYIFIPNWNSEIGEKELYQFASCLDKAINTSFAYSSSKTTHVHRISTVLGRPFYGFHKDEKSFLKIEFYNPAIVRRAADLLLNGAVLNSSFQPYEAHVPYILQFFIDNNLYGMSYVTLTSYRVRHEHPPDCSPTATPAHSSPCGVVKQSYTSLEIDSFVSCIVNDFKNSDDMPNNPGLAFIWEEERKRRRLQLRPSQITPNVSQIRPENLSTRSEQYYKRKLLEKLRLYKLNQVNPNKEGTSHDSVVFEEDEVNSSYEELNTQSRSILELLERMVNVGGETTKKKDVDTSPPSSPSVIFSDEETEQGPSNASMLSSQPLLKLPAEDDSILGTNFSDDEVDEDDHFLLSQTLFQMRPEQPFLENMSEDEDIQSIDQLDGASGDFSPSKGGNRKNNRKKNIAKKRMNENKRSYCLRSHDLLPDTNDVEENSKSSVPKAEPKISPKKAYPQLQIDTQRSPRSSARVSTSDERSEISEHTHCPSPESFITTFAPEKLLSPTTSSHSQSRKSESKRPYPQLDVNIKTSPRTGVKTESEEEAKFKKGTRVLKKRKINFDVSNGNSSLDMTLMTTRWKKQFQNRAKKVPGNGKDVSNTLSGEVCQNNHGIIIPALSSCKQELASIPTNSSPGLVTYTISNEIGSQKYSLKIRLDSCGSADGRELLENLLTKTPIVRIERMKIPELNTRRRSSDYACTSQKPSEPDQNVNSYSTRSSEDGSVTSRKSESVFLDAERKHTVIETRSRIRAKHNLKNGVPITFSHDACSSGSSENSVKLRRTERESSSEIDFFDEKKIKESSELDFFTDENYRNSFPVSPSVRSIIEIPIKGSKLPTEGDVSSVGAAVVPLYGNDQNLETVILSKSSRSSNDSSASFVAATVDNCNVGTLKKENEATVLIDQNRDISNDFPSANVRVHITRFLDSDGRKYSEVDDDQFTVPNIDIISAPARIKSKSYSNCKEEFPPGSDLFASPPVLEDEELATIKCSYSFEDEENFTQNPTPADNGMYSSVDDDEFPEPAVSQINIDVGPKPLVNDQKLEIDVKSPKQSTAQNNVSHSMFSQNSDEDEAFANLDLDNLANQNKADAKISSPKSIFTKNETSTTFISSISRTCPDVATVICINDDVDIVDDFPEPDLCISNNKITSDSHEVPDTNSTKPRFCDNSIWDSVRDPSDDDEQIRSFYSNKSVPSVDSTTFQHDKTQDEKSFLADKVSTPQNVDEIMSFYDSESPVSASEADMEALSQNEKSSPIIRKLSDGMRSDESSPTSPKPDVLHSTPQSTGKKKSPSPTYTPILKRLMLKKMDRKKRGNKSRMSSQRFQSELFLADIKEEEERKDEIIADVSVKLSLNNSDEKTNTDKKCPNSSRSSCNNGSGEIDITLANTYGFRMNLENLQDVKTEVQHQFVTIMSMEIFTTTRGDLNPDPEFDAVSGIFYSIFVDDSSPSKLISGVIMVVGECTYTLDLTRFNCEKIFVKTEEELFDSFITLIRKWDPDIFVGYEVEMQSWGYLIQRGQFLGRNYDLELSRLKEVKSETPKDKTIVEDTDYSDDLKLVGRIVLNVWRLMRHEIALQSYSFENIIFHILHQRVPLHSFRVLTEWWRNSLRKWIVIDYYLLRAEGNIFLLQQLDFIGRTSELARLFGIQFYEVLSRGSQFRVESMMLRLAKTRNFVAVSPSTKQRAAMRAPESLPLIMEPESKYYTDPVIVLDFQSLYPSIIIAYNYCFSTCLGRVEYLADQDTFKFGCLQHTVPADLLMELYSSLNISPCGVAFVNRDVRIGVLPSMLQEILDTRLMVKKSMKENKDNSTLQRVLHARQLGLKLIANVTYGYTSANFSGRMPCIEVGDSVVSKGRETLERVIEMVSKTEKWGSRVIYGDTDSIFVLAPNRTKEEAFRIGAEIAEAVTNDNPKPVKLKLEKVYYPCILQTKKRYVGYMYESPEQNHPVYDAKGIETVRRDGCPAVSKILEKSLKLLFDHKEINVIKQYVQRQFSKLISGRLSIQELTFAREYRGLNNYKPSACVPALQLARQAVLRDRRSEPRVKERVRYVLTAGPPGVPLIRSVRTPQQFLDTPGSIINAEYYITRAIIPALERCFSLLNVDVRQWYAELPRKQKLYLPVENDIKNKAYKKKTISHYFAASKCIACEDTAISGVCKECQKNPQRLALVLGKMINSLQRRYNNVEKICRSCCARNGAVECSSLDCPTYYTYRQAVKDIEQVPHLEELQQTFLRR